jgi:hypothetical protein
MTDEQETSSGVFNPNRSLLLRFKEASVMVKILAGFVLLLIVAAIPIAYLNKDQSHIPDIPDNKDLDDGDKLEDNNLAIDIAKLYNDNLPDDKAEQTVKDTILAFGKSIETLGSTFEISTLNNILKGIRKDCAAAGLSIEETLKSLSVPIENLVKRLAEEASTKEDAVKTQIAKKIDELINLKLADSLTGTTGAEQITAYVEAKMKEEEAKRRKQKKIN